MSIFTALDRRRIFTVLAVLLIAFLSGHLMQTVLANSTPVAVIEDGPDAAPVLRGVQEPKPLPVPPAATLMPILERPPVMPDRTITASPPAEHEALAPKLDCGGRLSVMAAPAATLKLILDAPCHVAQPVLIRHAGLVLGAETDGDGRLELRLPAFDADAEVSVTLGGRVLKATVEVPDAEDFQRVALVWSGPQVLRLNAYEFGAGRNDAGHVWSGSPKSPMRASRRAGGFLTRFLSDTGPSAEVYTFPAGLDGMHGVVRLVVEARVTAGNCGRIAEAIALQPTPFRRLGRTDVQVALPDCDRVGDVVLLQNLLRDVRLAGR